MGPLTTPRGRPDAQPRPTPQGRAGDQRSHDRTTGIAHVDEDAGAGRPTGQPSRTGDVATRRRFTGLGAIRVVIGILLVVDVAAWFLVPGPAEPIGDLRLPVLGVALLVAIAELASIHLDIGRERHTISMAELPFTLGLFLLTPQEQLLAQAIGLGLVLTLIRRQSLLKLAFNLTQSWAATAAGVVVFHLLADAAAGALSPRNWVLAMIAAVVAAVASAMIVSHVIALMDGRVGFQKPRESAVGAAIGALGNASFALLVVALLELAPRALGLLTIPVIAMFGAYRVYERQRAANRSLSFLYSISQSLAAEHEVDTSLAELADTVRQRMNVRITVVVVGPSSDGPRATGIVARATEGREPEIEHRSLSDREQAAISALHRSGSVRLTQGEPSFGLGFDPALLAEMELPMDAILVSLSGADRPLGFIVVADRLGDLDALTGRDQDLLAAVANQLSTSLTAARLESSLSELHRLQETLRHRADHDALTGLCNRSRFTTEVDDELRRDPRSTAVLFLDLDDFKTINDSMGHHVGDELLRAVARRLEGAIKISDLVARLGGDEFAVLLRDVDEHGAHHVADRLAQVLAEPFELDIGRVTVGTSVGIAQHFGEDPISASTLLRNADAAMYAAKRDGGTRTRAFEQAMHEQARERLLLRNDLQRAMTEHEFLIHAQPLVELTTGRVVGAEALLRWEHPDRSMLAPGAFLDLAEETGLMRELGHRVLRESCLLAATWPEDTIVSVNVSRSQLLADDRLISEVADALHDADLEPSRLVLEVTEFAVTSNVDRAVAMLRELAGLGVRVAMDDFGTGYSSLQHLARLPIHVLKIAKPFVEALSGTRADQASLIAHGIIQMAEALGLETIAEGIEDPAQAEALRRWGCRLGQGYLLGRPMPPADLLVHAGWGSQLPTLAHATVEADAVTLDG